MDANIAQAIENMKHVLDAAKTCYFGSSNAKAELYTKLVEAQSRLAASTQAEIANLLKVADMAHVVGPTKAQEAANKALELLGM